MALQGDPAWTVVADGGHLIVTAGADAVWLVEDVPAAVVAVAARYWTPDPPTDAELTDEARPVVAHLAALGALRPRLPSVEAEPVGLLVVGDPVPDFGNALGRRLAWADGSAGPGGLTVVVRTNAALRALMPVAADLAGQYAPHVLCDLAYHHTIGLGPHVSPGDTACLACLAGRVGSRWGDPDPPVRPAVAAQDTELAALVLARWVLGRDDPAGSLANATVSIDLVSLASHREPLWRSPGCPICADRPGNGRVALPWVAEPP